MSLWSERLTCVKAALSSDSHSYNHLNHVLLCLARSSCLYCQTTRGCHGGPQRQGQGNWSECLFLISHFNLIRFYLELLVAFEFTPVLTVPVYSCLNCPSVLCGYVQSWMTTKNTVDLCAWAWQGSTSTPTPLWPSS